MIKGEEIKNHVFKENPFLLLDKYPGVLQLLKQRTGRDYSGLSWREMETLIQHDGWTCNLTFHWRYTRGKFEVESVEIFKVCKAPDEKDQMELLT